MKKNIGLPQLFKLFTQKSHTNNYYYIGIPNYIHFTVYKQACINNIKLNKIVNYFFFLNMINKFMIFVVKIVSIILSKLV